MPPQRPIPQRPMLTLLHTLSSLLLRGNTIIGLDGNARLSSSQSAQIGPHGAEAETHTSPH
eukprot:9745554-Prorocentrum_lima.AAC.1